MTSIFGGDGNDILNGTDSNDIIDGLRGADKMIGGKGFDVYYVDNIGDQVIEAVDNNQQDQILASVSLSAAQTANVERIYLIGGNIDASLGGTGFFTEVFGSAGDNKITGTKDDDEFFGFDGNDTLIGNAGRDELNGGNGNDFIDGGADGDQLIGDDGDDTILGGAGRDFIDGDGDPFDKSNHPAGNGNDTLDGGAGDDFIFGDGGNDRISGGADSDTLSGGDGDDTIDGGSGDDRIDGGDGADLMIGGAGNDSYTIRQVGDVVVELANGGHDSIESSIDLDLSKNGLQNVEDLIMLKQGGGHGIGNDLNNFLLGVDGDDILEGGKGNDTLLGQGDNDTLIGGDGNDILDGGYNNGDPGNPNHDTLTGGAGNDTYILHIGGFDAGGQSSVVTINEDAGGGIDTVTSGEVSVDLGSLSEQLENVVLTEQPSNDPNSHVSLDLSAFGNGTANIITGNAGNNTLAGGDGNDTLIGGLGNDVYLIGVGDVVNGVAKDTIIEAVNAGHDTVVSTAHDYTLTANVEDLLLDGGVAFSGTGNALNNFIRGTSSDNLLDGGAGDDTLDGQSGADKLIGGAGNDTYLIDNLGDQAIEAANGGIDTVRTTADNYTLADNVENLVLMTSFGSVAGLIGNGNKLNNVIDGTEKGDGLHGGAGNDTIFGHDGNDLITGDDGNDTLDGGSGDDVMGGGDGNDTFIGGLGLDQMIGGKGNDTYFVGVDDTLHGITLDKVTETADGGIDTVVSNAFRTNLADIGENIENLVLTATVTGISSTSAIGNSIANVITGNASRNDLEGGGGDDTLIGGDGADTYTLRATDTNDKIVELGNADGGRDFVFSSLANYTLTANVEGLILSSKAGDINGTGNELNNQVTGNEGNNRLDGAGGSDSLFGDAGNDVIFGGAGADNLEGWTGDDELHGGTGNDTYTIDDTGDKIFEDANGGIDRVFSLISFDLSKDGVNVENLILDPENNVDSLTGIGNTLNNHIEGRFGDDVIAGRQGDDLLEGSIGNDTLSGDEGNDVLLGGLGADKEFGGDGNDALDYRLFSNGQLDTNASAGADEMHGGKGDDIYLVNSEDDKVFEAAGEGKDTIFGTVSAHLDTVAPGQEIEFLTLLGTDNIEGTGNEFGNVITGNSAGNLLIGFGGVDTLIGGLGNDTYDVLDDKEDGLDKIVENANGGIDTVFSGLTNYTLAANVENLHLLDTALNGTGNTLDNSLIGNSGSNILDGGAGNDTLDGGAGADKLIGGAGNDTYTVDDSGDQVVEAANQGTADQVNSTADYDLSLAGREGVENLNLVSATGLAGIGNALNNNISGTAGNDDLHGGGGNDTIHGNAGQDFIVGDDGNDQMFGDAENDRLLGGAGNDTLLGGAGADTLQGGDGNDILDAASGGSEAGGADSMFGGRGNDVYFVDNKDDKVSEADGDGIDLIMTTVDYTMADGIENMILLGSALNAEGSDQANTITGNALNNTLSGGAGDDTLIGGAGDDTYILRLQSFGRHDDADKIVETANGGTDRVISALLNYTLAANVENLELATNGGEINGTGNALNNHITGNFNINILDGGAGNDTLDGGAGGDTMKGGAGDDTFIVDSLDDTVVEVANQGHDTVRSSALAFALGDNVEDLVLLGTALGGEGNKLDNVITGNDVHNNLFGHDGNDTLNGGGGTDSLDGGDGNDKLNGGDGDDQGIGGSVGLLGGAGNDSLSGDAGDDIMDGGTGNDTLLGGLGRDIMFGGDGNDLLDVLFVNGVLQTTGPASAGADEMHGGKGDDTYFVQSEDDKVFEATGEGKDTIFGSVSVHLDTVAPGQEIEFLTLVGTDNIEGTGNEFGNVITGNSGNNLLIGFGGNDTLIGGLGNDTYDVLAGDELDKVVENANGGIDKVFSALANYTLTANVENLDLLNGALNGTGNDLGNIINGNGGDNILDGAGGVDVLNGGGGTDTLKGGAGNDVLDGGAGDDIMEGGAGDDFYTVDSFSDTIKESANQGRDTVLSSAFNYTLADNVEDLVLIGSGLNAVGNTLNNKMLGTNASNQLVGGAGDDTLDGGGVTGGGGDDLRGGTGNDTYIIHSVDDLVVEGENEGFDTIKAVDVDGQLLMNLNVENLIVTGKFGTDVEGNSSANVITGNEFDNTLQGDGGNDTLIGGLGSDRYILQADDAQDKIVENANGGFDVVDIYFATPTAYVLGANIEQVDLFGQASSAIGNALDNDLNGNNNNVIYHLDGGAGNDLLIGAGADDFLIGGTGNDELFGGEGADHMTGGAGDDTYGVDNVGDVVIEAKNGGIDTIDAAISVDLNVQGTNIENLFLEGDDNINGTGNELDNWMIGSRGNNIIVGAGGNDTLDGHQGDDILAGGSGNDVLEGGTGKDTMSGDGGNDIFLYRADSLTPLATLGGDTINNFESGKDKIDIHDLFVGLHIDETKNPFADGHLALVSDGQGNTLLQFDADGAGAGAAMTLATIHQQPIAQTDIIY